MYTCMLVCLFAYIHMFFFYCECVQYLCVCVCPYAQVSQMLTYKHEIAIYMNKELQLEKQ